MVSSSDSYDPFVFLDELADEDEPVPESTAPFQVMPGLTGDEEQELRSSIGQHGVLQPIDVDEDGNILDGHNRARIAAELGIDCPRRVVVGLDGGDAKRAYALKVNCERRQLSREAQRQLVRQLREHGWSLRRIASETAISKSTVQRDAAVPDGTPAGTPAPQAIQGSDVTLSHPGDEDPLLARQLAEARSRAEADAEAARKKREDAADRQRRSRGARKRKSVLDHLHSLKCRGSSPCAAEVTMDSMGRAHGEPAGFDPGAFNPVRHASKAAQDEIAILEARIGKKDAEIGELKRRLSRWKTDACAAVRLADGVPPEDVDRYDHDVEDHAEERLRRPWQIPEGWAGLRDLR